MKVLLLSNVRITTFGLLYIFFTSCRAFHVLSNTGVITKSKYPYQCNLFSLSRTIQQSSSKTKNLYVITDNNKNDVENLETITPILLDDDDDDTTKYNKKDPAIRVPDCHAQATRIWKECLVPNIWQSQYGIDQSIQWSIEDDLQDIAFQLLNKVNVNDNIKMIHLQRDLVKSMMVFTKFCESNLSSSKQKRVMIYKARIVCSRGQVASSKCPRWHIDHVPIRWIQSLVGPGVMWINPDAVLWTTFITPTNNDDYNDDSDDDNDRIDTKAAIIYQAKVGEAVMIQGNRWNEFSSTQKIPYPVVHKSPTGLLPWEGRVLFTMDIEFH